MVREYILKWKVLETGKVFTSGKVHTRSQDASTRDATIAEYNARYKRIHHWYEEIRK